MSLLRSNVHAAAGTADSLLTQAGACAGAGTNGSRYGDKVLKHYSGLLVSAVTVSFSSTKRAAPSQCIRGASKHEGMFVEQPTEAATSQPWQTVPESEHSRLGAATARLTAALLTSDTDVICKILKHVPFEERREDCPLVCKKVRTF